jgi:nucleoside permease NupC
MREAAMSDTQGPSIQRLLGDALRESSDLARKELALFRTEMSDNVRTIAMGLVMVIAAAVVSILALIWLTQALVDWLATKVGSHALAALIVGGVLAVVAIGLGLYGRSAMSKTSLAPKRTARSIQRDAEVLTERAPG